MFVVYKPVAVTGCTALRTICVVALGDDEPGLRIASVLLQDGSTALQSLRGPHCGQIIKDGLPQQDCQEIVMVGTTFPF